MRKNKRTQSCLNTSLNSITCSGSLGMISAFYSTPFCWCKDIKYNLKYLLEMFIFCLSLLDIRWFYDISGFYCSAK